MVKFIREYFGFLSYFYTSAPRLSSFIRHLYHGTSKSSDRSKNNSVSEIKETWIEKTFRSYVNYRSSYWDPYTTLQGAVAVCMYVCMYVRTYVHTYIHTYVHTHTDMHCVTVLDWLHTKLLEWTGMNCTVMVRIRVQLSLDVHEYLGPMKLSQTMESIFSVEQCLLLGSRNLRNTSNKHV